MSQVPPPIDDDTLVACEVTGKVLPEDQIVQFQGYRVSAEGKAILMDRLRSGEGTEGMARPTVLRRFGCILLDGIITVAVMFGLGLVIGMAMATQAGTKEGLEQISDIAELIGAILVLLYFGFMHGTSGQTIGKKAGKLKVVNLDGSDITMGTGFLRAIFYVGPTVFFAVAAFFFVNNTLERGDPIDPPLLVCQGLVGVYGLTNIIMALVDTKQQRSLHDRLAGTRVIQLDV